MKRYRCKKCKHEMRFTHESAHPSLCLFCGAPEIEAYECAGALSDTEKRERMRQGGLTVSANRNHMVEIGRRGGLQVSRDRFHMSEIGRKGGAVMKAKARVK